MGVKVEEILCYIVLKAWKIGIFYEICKILRLNMTK